VKCLRRDEAADLSTAESLFFCSNGHTPATWRFLVPGGALCDPLRRATRPRLSLKSPEERGGKLTRGLITFGGK
jgi:hypothetical protein